MVLWGTGNVCNHLLQSNPKIQPEFFIDNNQEREEVVFYGKEIKHPSRIENWKTLYIVVTLDNYVPVKAQLEKEGLKEGENFIWYRDFLFQKSFQEIEEEAEKFCGFLKKQALMYRSKSIVFSDFLAFDKGVCKYINDWSKNGLDAVLLSEAYWVSDLYAKEMMQIPVCKLPAILAHNQYLKGKCAVNQVITEYVQGKDYLEEARQNLRMGYPKMAVDYEYLICFWADKIVKTVLDCWQPKEVILWNAFYAFHKIVRSICEEKKIPIRYMEFGNIPGMIQVETLGQMGESYPARFPEEVLNIKVSKEELQETSFLIQELYQKKANRNAQPQNNLLEDVKKQLVPNRPIVFYVGQNDNAAGLQPYTENSREYHSPIFKSSDEAAVYLAELCKKNEWNFIYKPHPMMMEAFGKSRIPDNAIVVDNVDINGLIDIATVVVTILSTVSYNALIRNKPVLMLGYTQLKGKGCTYEAFEEMQIESRLQQALKDGRPEKQKQAFVKHVIQLKKAYLDGRC